MPSPVRACTRFADRGIHVDVGHDGNAALLNSSLLLLASRLNQLDPHKPREVTGDELQ